MIQKEFDFTKTNSKTIERIISDGNADINHMVLPKGDALPIHNSNSNVYMFVVRGTITLKLGNQKPYKYEAGKIINIPYDTRMHVFNEDDDILEFFVVKTPSPSKN